MMYVIIFIIILIFILDIAWFALWLNDAITNGPIFIIKRIINKHKLNHFHTKEFKLIKKRKVTYLFLDEDNETKYILR